MRDRTVSDLEELLRQARSARAPFEPDWFLNLAFFEGEQWVGWDGNRLFRPQLRRGRMKLVDNRIMPTIEKEVARLTKQKPTYVTTPASPADEDIYAAELSEQVLDYLWNHLDVQPHFYEALKWSRICGAGFIKTVWDRSLGDGFEILVGPDGKPLLGADDRPLRGLDPEQLTAQLDLEPGAVQSRRLNRGDIRISVCSPWQIYPDPLAGKLEDAEWLIEENVLSADHVRDRYGRRIEPNADANPGMVQTRLGANPTSAYKGVKVYEYHRRPCRDHPNGLRVVWSGREELERDERPFDAMPYNMFRGIDVPGRFWPMAIAEALRDPQVELNKVKSQLAENRNRVGNPTLLASQSAIGDPDQFERQVGVPGGVLYYNDNSQNAIPTYLEAPQMPEYVVREIERIESSFQEISAQHEVTSGTVPAGVTAASAINLLQESDDTRLGPAATDLARQLGIMGSKQLSLVGRFYDDQRTIAILGEDRAWEVQDFRGQMLRNHTHVQVQAASMIPQSKAARQAAMQNVMNMNIQNGVPMRPRQLAKFVRDYDVGGLEHLITGFDDDEQQVNRENRRLSQGVAVALNDFDDDEAHVELHQAFQKGSTYDRLPAPVKALVDAHVAEHKAKLQRLAAAQQMAEAAPDAQQQMQMQTTQEQAGQQMQNQAEQHAQRLQQQDELHQQRMQQQPAQQ